jgi:hypothetical protein
MNAVRVLFIDDNIYDALHRQASNLLGIVIDFDNRTKNIFINEFFTEAAHWFEIYRIFS